MFAGLRRSETTLEAMELKVCESFKGSTFVESDTSMLILGIKASMFFGKPSLGWKISLAFGSIIVYVQLNE